MHAVCFIVLTLKLNTYIFAWTFVPLKSYSSCRFMVNAVLNQCMHCQWSAGHFFHSPTDKCFESVCVFVCALVFRLCNLHTKSKTALFCSVSRIREYQEKMKKKHALQKVWRVSLVFSSILNYFQFVVDEPEHTESAQIQCTERLPLENGKRMKRKTNRTNET